MENADHDKVSFESEAKINFYLLAVQFIKKKQKNSGVYVINRRQVGPLPESSLTLLKKFIPS